MKRIPITSICAFALTVSLQAVADYVDISGKDPSEWPTSGDITITSGIITVTDSEAAIVAGWDKLLIVSPGQILFANTSVACTLNANVSGNGYLKAKDSCGLTLAGNNSAHYGNQCWSFTDSDITVANEYGLGGADPEDNLRCEFYYTIGNTTGNLTFHDPKWDDPDFTGKKAFTNHCNIRFMKQGTGSVPSNGKTLAIGSSALDEYFVQDGDFTYNFYANDKIPIRGNYEQISGKFASYAKTGSYTMTGSTDPVGEFRFSGTARINTRGGTDTLINWLNYHVKTYFGHTGGTHAYFAQNTGTVTFEADNVFEDVETGGDPVVFKPINMGQTTYRNCFDLNGHSQRFSRFDCWNGARAKETSTDYYYLTSEEPATVTLYKATKAGTATGAIPVELRGALSLTVDNGLTNQIATRVSTTTGTLTIKEGSAVHYLYNGGWAGKAIVMEGGILDAESAKSLSSGTSALTMAAGAKLKLHAGSDAVFTTATVGGQHIYIGDYTVASFKAKYPAVADCIAGDDAAVIKVQGTAWAGWPDVEDGGIVEIPANTQVTIEDADIAKVQKVGELRVSAGSTVTVGALASTLVIKANIWGEGTVRIADDLTGVILTGNNAGLVSPGHFDISNAKVAVSNEFGLGSAQTAAATIKFTAASRDLLTFGLADRTAFTNHVAIAATCDANAGMTFGSSSADETFVQDANLTTDKAGLNNPVCFRNNYEQISGTLGFKAYYGQPLKFQGLGTAAVRISGTTLVSAGELTGSKRSHNLFLYGGSATFYWSNSGGVHALGCNRDTGKDVVAGDGLFTASLTGAAPKWNAYPQAQGYYKNSMDLNGHSITLKGFSNGYGDGDSKKTGDTYYYFMNDGAAATVTVAATEAFSAAGPVEFRGNTSVLFDIPGSTNMITRRTSAPNGTLTVRNGCAQLSYDAQWNGTGTIVEGGKILADNAKAFSGGNSSLTMTGGKLEFTANCTAATFTLATLGGTELDLGEYTLAQLRAQGFGDYFDGDDAVKVSVLGATGEFAGWPATAGATVEIPQGKTVTIAADDLTNVAKAAKIRLGKGSTVVCSGLTDALAIQAKVCGLGTFRIVDCAEPVTLLGDNGNLASPGCFYIENSYVCVSNEHGLGSAKTAAATVKFTSADRPLVFGLADGRDLTNEVAVVCSGTGSTQAATPVYFGTETPEEKLVQKGSFTLNWGDNYARRMGFKGNVEFQGVFKINAVYIYIANKNKTVLRFGEDATLLGKNDAAITTFAIYNPMHPNAGEVRFDCKEKANISTLYYNIANIILERDNQFGEPGDSTLHVYYFRNPENAWYYQSVLDLNGHALAVKSFGCQDEENLQKKKNITNYATVTSAVAAVMTLQSDVMRSRYEALRFFGAAGFCYNGVGTNIFVGVKSPTAGSFEVKSGVAGFDWGAGWGGADVKVNGTGTLYVGAESAGAFGAESGAQKSAAVLKVNDSGKVYLESGTTTVLNAYASDEQLNRGSYCAEDNAEAIGSGAVAKPWISGSGVLKVLKGKKRGLLILFQ